MLTFIIGVTIYRINPIPGLASEIPPLGGGGIHLSATIWPRKVNLGESMHQDNLD